MTEGRQALNFSTWPGGSKEPENAAKETREVVMEGEMPPWDYALMHTESRLTQEEKQALVRGLQATLALANSRNPAERDGAVSARSDGDDDGEERKKPRRR